MQVAPSGQVTPWQLGATSTRIDSGEPKTSPAPFANRQYPMTTPVVSGAVSSTETSSCSPGARGGTGPGVAVVTALAGSATSA